MTTHPPLATASGGAGGSRSPCTVHRDEDRWVQIEELVRTSYSLVAPKALARPLPEIASR